MNKKKIPLIAVVGPTASGKTALAIELAKRYNGEIISADSMQIYKGMPIATAAPTKEEKKEAVHYLTEFLEPTEKFSVADYILKAKEIAEDIHNRGKMPILVGGTGLYVNCLIDGIKFSEEKNDSAVRKSLEDEYDKIGGEEMLSRLAVFDKETADRLSANDKKRIVRAFEVYRVTGVTLSRQKEISREDGSPFFSTIIGIAYNDREKLYERINLRVEKMLSQGLLEEAKAFDFGPTSSQAIGHKEFKPYFEGKISLEEAVENLKKETRHYAKRQMTWFRKRTDVNWIYADSENVLNRAIEIIERNKENV